MKHIILFISIVGLLFSCNTKPELSKDFLLGKWQCFDAVISGDGISKENMELLKQTSMETEFEFDETKFYIVNKYYNADFTYTTFFSEKENRISVTPHKNGAYLKKTEFTIIDHSDNILVLQEQNDFYSQTLYLQRK